MQYSVLTLLVWQTFQNRHRPQAIRNDPLQANTCSTTKAAADVAKTPGIWLHHCLPPRLRDGSCGHPVPPPKHKERPWTWARQSSGHHPHWGYLQHCHRPDQLLASETKQHQRVDNHRPRPESPGGAHLHWMSRSSQWATHQPEGILVLPRWACRWKWSHLQRTPSLIPKELRKGILTQLHNGHQGIEKTCNLARETVYWPGVTGDIQRVCKSCQLCQEMQPQQPRQPMQMHEKPGMAWVNVGTDLFEADGCKFLIISYYFSRYPVIKKLTSTTSDKTEFLLIGNERQWRKYLSMFPIELLDIKTNPAKSARNLGVIFDKKQPVYLHSMLAASIPSRSLRWNNDNSLSVPRVKTSNGARVFHSCAPSLWNNLPLSVRLGCSVATCKKYLKTHVFDLAFPP